MVAGSAAAAAAEVDPEPAAVSAAGGRVAARRAEEGAFHDKLEFDLGDLEETGAAVSWRNSGQAPTRRCWW